MRTPPDRRLTILLVAEDDGGAVRRALEGISAKDTIHVAHEHEAVSLLHSDTLPHARRVIVIDLADPLPLARALRADRELRLIPVIVFARDRAAAAEALRMQVAGFYKKPEREDEVANAVRTIHSYWSAMELA